MDDLISRKSLLEQIKLANSRSFLGETTNGFNLSGIEIVGIIKDMSTSYDVDKVIKELNKCSHSYPFGTWHDMIEEALEIVNGGFINENVQ